MSAASVLAKQNNASLRVIDVGLADAPFGENDEWSGLVVRSSEKRVRGGTKNFCVCDAMTEVECERCISTGREETAKFIDEIKNIADLLAGKADKHGVVVKILGLFARLCGFFYYLLDNVVWFSNMGMIK